MRQFNSDAIVVVLSDDIIPILFCGKVEAQETNGQNPCLTLAPLSEYERDEINNVEIIKTNPQIMLAYKTDIPIKNIKRIYTVYEGPIRN